MENIASVFISYASPDRDRVLPFFDWLKNRGINVWMDFRSIKAGQNWEHEIRRALDRSTFVLSFISEHSFNRRGYIQKELKIALDKRDEKLIDDIYIIPVLLDDVALPDQLKDLHCVKASDPNCREQIEDSLHHQLERLGIERREVQEKERIYWSYEIKHEEWDGIPGYEVELQFINFSSDMYPNVSEITDYIRGDLLASLFEHRTTRFFPSPDLFNYGQVKFARTNTHDAHCSEPSIQGKVISVLYTIYWYGAGAAHRNQYFKSYVFLLDPIIKVDSLESIFKDPVNAFEEVQRLARERLKEISLNDSEADDATLDDDWIQRGTLTWEHFRAFIFRADAIEILFEPYQVAAYAYGPQSVKIPYEKLISMMDPVYISALELEFLKYKNYSVTQLNGT